MEYRKTYEFSYKDNEGDLYDSGQFESQRLADLDIKQLSEHYGEDFEVVETWIYKEYKDGTMKFVGRWR